MIEKMEEKIYRKKLSTERSIENAQSSSARPDKISTDAIERMRTGHGVQPCQNELARLTPGVSDKHITYRNLNAPGVCQTRSDHGSDLFHSTGLINYPVKSSATENPLSSISKTNYRPHLLSSDMGYLLESTVTDKHNFVEQHNPIEHQYSFNVTRGGDRACDTASDTATRHSMIDAMNNQGYLSQHSIYALTGARLKVIGHECDTPMQKKIDIERLDSAAKFLALVEQMGAMPYLANLDQSGTPFYISKKFENLVGFTSEQWCSNPDLRISQIHPDDRNNVLLAIDETLLSKGAFSLDYRLLTQEGRIRWVHDEARVITNTEGMPVFLQGVILDISECRQAQEELERSQIELQKLIGALDALREKEQKRLAQEMHDDLGQLLAAMKIDLSTLQRRIPANNPHLSEQVENLNDLVDTMVSSVRRIIADLPPKIMEDRGLFNALSLLTSNFEKRHGIIARLEAPKIEPELGDCITTPIYRIVQEALNNVAKHSGATRVAIQIDCFEHYLVIGINDDGIGMTICEMQKNGSFGLISMRERVNALGGEMKVESSTGNGTSIRIVIPT